MTKGVQDRMVEVERIRDAFHSAIFSAAGLEAALALTTADCVLVNLPSGTGAAGDGRLRSYLARDLQPPSPTDLAFAAPSSRLTGRCGTRPRCSRNSVSTQRTWPPTDGPAGP